MAGKSSQSNNRGTDLFGYFVSGKHKEYHTNQHADSSPAATSGLTANGDSIQIYNENTADAVNVLVLGDKEA